MRYADPPSPRRGVGATRASRRALLRGLVGVVSAGIVAGGAGATLAGCDLFGRPGVEDPATHELAAFLAATVALGDRYERAMTAVPALREPLTPLREAHRAHAQTLAAAIGAAVPPVASAAGAPFDQGQATAELRRAEEAGRDAAIAVCLSAPARLAALLGSIAAARASHAEALA